MKTPRNGALILALMACAIALTGWWDTRRRLGELREQAA